jgi:hypothetical protein
MLHARKLRARLGGTLSDVGHWTGVALGAVSGVAEVLAAVGLAGLAVVVVLAWALTTLH